MLRLLHQWPSKVFQHFRRRQNFSTAPSRKGIKRFYEKVAVGQQQTTDASCSYQVLLDGRPIRSPAQSSLKIPTEDLATIIALEWDSIGELIEPHLMPMMTAVSTVTDHLPKNRDLYYDELLKYLDTDTICIRAPPQEEELHALQKEKWDPLLHWMGDTLNCHLESTHALGKKPPHREDARSIAAAHMHTLSDFELQALLMFTTVCKSLSIGFALLHGKVSIEEGISAGRLEEEYQIKQWGMVEGGHDVDRVHIAVQVACARVLLRTQGSMNK
jgi:ATP synthase F1 complex assembly factor 2